MLADSGKFGKASLVKLCVLNEVDDIITDSAVDEQIKETVKQTGVSLHVVPAAE